MHPLSGDNDKNNGNNTAVLAKYLLNVYYWLNIIIKTEKFILMNLRNGQIKMLCYPCFINEETWEHKDWIIWPRSYDVNS